METDGISLVRRQSGGGTVYQDLGNTCFTFLSSKENYSTERNFNIITNALKKRFDLNAEKSGRNDLVIDGKKISGSGFKQKIDRALHHGTLLRDVDMDALAKYLNPNKLKLESKGVQSVRSRVVNLKTLVPNISHESMCDAITQEFFETHQQECEIEDLDEDKLRHNASLMKHYKEYQDWDWRFGSTPNFKHHMETRFDWGTMDVHVDSKKD